MLRPADLLSSCVAASSSRRSLGTRWRKASAAGRMSGQRARAWRRMANWPWPRSPGSHGCCKQWIQDRETVHSTRWRSGKPRRATVATTRGWTVVESPTGWTVFQIPSTPSAPLSRRIGDVRARIDRGLLQPARERSRSSSPGRQVAGAASCAMAEGPGDDRLENCCLAVAFAEN